MNTNNPSNMTRDSVSAMQKTSDDMMNSAGKAIEATREHANQALDRAESKVRELRGSVDPMVEVLAAKAQKMARQSLDMASEAKERAEKSLKHAADATTRYVSEQPMRSVLIAAAVGAAVALLVSTSRQRNHNRY
ncbi:FIG00931134: hypothetical protein [Polaromonas sp. CG9_12]|uniref:DUF883 family protein n=1 Tax=Polaromonas sp. CG_9.11 TaxID=2787730 RepID=UPI0004DDCB11|nr:DUF883 family protein [Polaromonas sp. CG_9.11]MBG6077186.1 ElaB/YqjD/DUF883 family membrane-anchored ribosome-binding protein [Polaromonas sp. CG_9.11]CDS51001.1 FIG00931134: hypothetical protein [Polaromonas sp. CG9_12]